MALAAPEQSANWAATETSSGGIHQLVTPVGLDALHMVLERAIMAGVGGKGALLSRVLTESIDAFVTHDGASRPAASHMAPLLREVGSTCARRGRDSDELAESFRRAQTATQRGLQFAVVRSLPRERMDRIRADATSYVDRLHHHAREGWEWTRTLSSMSNSQLRAQLGSSVLRPDSSDPATRQRLAELAQINLSAEYVLLVATTDDLLHPVYEWSGALVGINSREALVPSASDLSELAGLLPGQVVVSPPVVLHKVADAAGATRRGAALLREGLVRDPRTLVPCTDLLASLVVDGNPRLTDLIVAKHLSKMDLMTPQRRLTTGTLFLHWLEHGLSVNQLARDLGIPAQTAHSRMKNIRTLFGEAIYDPPQRLELIIALQATLPRWRAEAGTD